jgi:FlgD Ig-like domain
MPLLRLFDRNGVVMRILPPAHRCRLIGVLLLLSLAATGEARPPTIEVNQPATLDAEEMTIAINPANPGNLAGGANLNYRFHSTDGGLSWTQNELTSSLGVAGDPVVIFDAAGNLYYAHLSNPAGGSWLDRIVVQKSTDGGVTWNDGVGVGLDGATDHDKQWLAADRTDSPHHGNIYMSWTAFDTYGSSDPADSTRILFVRSVDQGESFSAPLRISDRGGNCIDSDETVEGAVPAVGPEGQVYVAWSGHDVIMFDRSLDAGQTFGEDIFVADQPGGWNFDVPGVWRVNGMPITACDVSGSSFRGRIYVLFSDQRNGAADTDVFLCTSDDEGLNWSLPSRVNDDVGTSQQFFPWMSVDPSTGYIYVVFYDRRNTGDAATEVYVAVSVNGGASFTNSKVSDSPFTPWNLIFFGDYIGIDAWGGVAYALWMRMDEGTLSVRGARLDSPSAVGDEFRPGVRTVQLIQAPANPVASQTRIRFTMYRDAPVQLAIYDLRGRLVRELVAGSRSEGSYSEAWDGTNRFGNPVPSGVYLCRLQAGRDVVTRKVSMVR